MFGDLFGDLQKRTGRYLLQRYLGQFLDGKLSLEQLNINLLNGRGTVNNVSLCCKSVNELCEEQGWGVEVIGGHIGQVTVTVPWNALLIDDSSIEVTNLHISLKPKPRETDGASMLESMWSSVSSSMQLAKECLENEGSGADVNQLNAQNPIEGLEKFAQTIENILKRVKAKFLNTEIRLEYIPPNSNKGIAIIIKIDYLNYQNEACNDQAEDSEGDDQDDNLYSADESTEPPADRNNQSRGQKTHFISSHSTHHITIEGITISTEEFSMEKKRRKDEHADDEHEALSVSSANTSSGIDNTSATSLISSTQFYSVILTDLPSEKKDQQSSFSSGLEDAGDDEVTVEDCNDDDEETEHEEDDEEEFDKRISNKSIPVIRIDGTQEVRIKVKEIDNISGPKVSLDLQIGAVFIFLSPRQIHLLTHFYDVYFNDSPSALPHNHPMAPDETEEKILIGGVGVGGWSDPLENFTSRSDLYSNSHRTATHQRHRPYCESLSDSITSTSTTTTTNSSRFHRKATNVDMNGDISSFNIMVASVYSIVLHEEVLFESCGRRLQPPLTEESTTNLLEISNYFFSCIEGNSVNNFKCEKNFLRAHVKPIIVNGIQQRSNNNILMKFKIFLTKCDLFEHLSGGRDIIPIVMFDRRENMTGGFLKRPEITLVFKSSTPATIYSSSSRRKMTQPKAELCILLETCTVELDISIYDRLSAIFSPSPFPQQSIQPSCVPVNSKYPQNLIELTVEAPIFNINLRFPIADCRPLHDSNRVPWWKQNIRPDFLQIVFYQFRLSVISTAIEILGNELDFFYCESESSPRIHFGKSNLVNCASGSGTAIQEDVDYPKISLEFPTNKKLNSCIQCIQEGSDSGETSGDGCDLYKHKSKISLPFCSKRVCRESDTPHVKKGMDETETVLLPGDKAELNKFCDRTMKTSKVQIKLHLPVVSLQIPSKHLYETIYNRLNTDLLMWEPSSPIAQSNLKNQNPIASEQSLYNIGMMDSMYVPPMNSTQIDNDIFGGHIRDDENSQSECESDSLYYSTYERKRSRKSQKEPANTINSSLCSFELTVSKGMLDFSTPVRDSENRVLPGQSGEFIILADNIKLFSVNGFNANEHLAYLCVQAKNAEIYHCGLLPFKEESNRTLRTYGSPIPHYMKSTLYATPNDLTKGEFVNENSRREMLSLVIEIKKNLDQRIKRIKLTVGIQKTALRYHPTLYQHSWLSQLIDFVDVIDYPIEGYKPFGIITEMQLHLWDCAIDYRPKFLNYRAVLEIGSLLLSSNIISAVTGCTLRFVPEECVFSLAPYDIIKRQPNDNVVSALPSKDLIPVIDIGLFDISLRINDKASESFPKLDLRASIHDIHIRTCSDSGRALAQLISYFASDGDYGGMGDKSDIGDEDSSMTTSHTSSIYCEADLLSMKECTTSNPEISPEQQERVTQMVADAVQETVRSPSASEELGELRYDERGVEVFYFPDETHQFPGDKKFRDISPSPSSMSTSPSRTNTPHKLQHRSTSDEWGFRARRESESSNELRDLLNFEENVMKRSYMVDDDNSTVGDEDEVVEALPQIREELGEIIHQQKVRFHSDLDDDYCVIGDEERIAMSQCGIKDVKLSEDPLRIVDNHFTPPLGKPDLLKAPENFPMAVMRYTLCEMTVVWHLYGGHDFGDADSDKDKENVKPKAHMSEAYKHGVSFSKNQNSVQFVKKPMEKISWKTKGGKNRNHDVLIEIQLTKVKFSHEEYPTTTTHASRQVLIVSEMEIRDRLQSSEINKFLHHPTGTFLPNKSSKHMVVIKALHVRPFPHRNPTQECSLRISLLPMRINIDQDTLLFFVQFFTELTETGNADFAEKRSSSTSSLQAPIMMVDDLPESFQDIQARKLVNKNIDLLMDDETPTSASVVFGPKDEKKDEDKADDSMSSISSSASDSSPIYFKEVVFSPEVLIRLDYVGRIQMSRGPIAGLLMGLGQLECSEIRLKQICHRHGILGFDKLFNFLFKEWLADIKKNQLPAILRGFGPTYTFVQLFQGLRDLFWLPIEQYQKDGRIVRGLQLGAQSFTARTAFAALEITSRIIQLLQFTAETAFDMVSPGPSSVRSRRHKKNKKKRLHRPQDIRQGFGNAYLIVKDGINERVNTVIENTMVEHDQKGYTGAAGAIIRQVPPMVLAPVVLATQATTNILGGVKNQLVPDAKYEAREKWKDDSD